MRLRRWLIAGSLVTALAACGGDPEPGYGPDEDGPIEANDQGQDQDPPPREKSRKDIVIKMETFAKDVLDLQAGDIVQVRLAKSGGILKGTLVSVKPRVLTVTGRGSSITSRFKPEEVTSVKLLYRDDPTAVTFTSDAPLYKGEPGKDETWLDRFADRSILGEDPADLWTDRFARNIALTVKRSFKIPVLSFLKRRGRNSYFIREEKKEIIRQYDQLKLVGLSKGIERNPEGGDKKLGEIYLYLVRHGQTVRLVSSLRAIGAKYLDAATVKRFLRSEPVVLAVTRPGSSKHLKIVRIPGAKARRYRTRMKNAPSRPEVRRLRAQRSADLEEAEKKVREIYTGVGLTEESDLEEAILVKLRVPSAEKGLRLVPFSKELGLD